MRFLYIKNKIIIVFINSSFVKITDPYYSERNGATTTKWPTWTGRRTNTHTKIKQRRKKIVTIRRFHLDPDSTTEWTKSNRPVICFQQPHVPLHRSTCLQQQQEHPKHPQHRHYLSHHWLVLWPCFSVSTASPESLLTASPCFHSNGLSIFHFHCAAFLLI